MARAMRNACHITRVGRGEDPPITWCVAVRDNECNCPARDRLSASRTRASLAESRLLQWPELFYVIDDGMVVECGDCDSLSARPAGRFRALREAQELGS
jgi:hypothetical protein